LAEMEKWQFRFDFSTVDEIKCDIKQEAK